MALSDAEKRSLLEEAKMLMEDGSDVSRHALEKLEKFKQALEIYNRIIDNSPHDHYCFSERAEVKFQLSCTLYRDDLLDGAIEDMNRAISLNPGKGGYYLHRGLDLWARLEKSEMQDEKQRKDIVSDFKSCLSKDPTKTSAWLDLMAFDIICGDYDEAISLYGQCKPYIDTKKDRLERAFLGCLALAFAGDPLEKEDMEALLDGTIRIDLFLTRISRVIDFVGKMLDNSCTKEKSDRLNDVMSLFISHYESGLHRGVMLARLKRYEQALGAYDEELELDPDYFFVLGNKSDALRRLGRSGEALRYIDKSIRLNPQDTGIWNNKGFVLQGLDRYGEALEAYDRALEINPRSSVAQKNREYILGIIAGYENSLPDRDGWRKNGFDALNERGDILCKLGRYEEALKCFDRAVKLKRGSSKLWHKKSTTLHRLGRGKKALACLDRAIKIGCEEIKAAGETDVKPDVDLAGYWTDRGEILEELGRYEEALKAYDRALTLDPKNTLAISNKKDVEKTMREM